MQLQETRPPITARLISAVTFHRNARAPYLGRHALAEWIGTDDPLLPDVLQVASELLTNAYVHPADGLGRESLLLRLSRGETFFLLEVIDPGTQPPCALPQPEPQSPSMRETGRGLGIVAECTATWGTYTTESGRRNVWAVLGDAPADGAC
ncbi:ATP-binding protein [Nonomuraea insulae]|uniref:ATP-binding protein n=1 Tax=Nonomuraea insulae TaxID=1616787 RepID=A0ABW1CCV6_9ACTN